MVKDTETIRRKQPTNCLIGFGDFVGLALKSLNMLNQLLSECTKSFIEWV